MWITSKRAAGIKPAENSIPRLLPAQKAGEDAAPAVSIVMPTFKRAPLIGESIRSLLDQTFTDFDLLIRDDCSPDDTEKAVARWKDPRIRYCRNPSRLGMPRNLNEGITDSTGNYILVCHDHDLYERSLVEKMVRSLEEHPTAAFVHAGILLIDQHGQPTGQRYVMGYPPVCPGHLWLSRMLSRFDCPVCADSMVRRKTYEEAGLYDPSLGFISDTEMWMRLSLHGDAAYLNEPLIQVREREPGHEYSGVQWKMVDALLRIQNSYHQRAFKGWHRRWRLLRLAMRTERYLLENYFPSILHKDSPAKKEGRLYLRSNGLFLSRLAARIV